MTPDNAEEEAASGVREAVRPGNGTHGHKHRRGKTGRARKKRRHWGLFSRWRTGESDDEDDIELYRWSKSRGLTARSLPAASSANTKPVNPLSRSKSGNDPAEPKGGATQRASSSNNRNVGLKRAASADAIKSMQEATFLTKLCSSIPDKKSFVDLSKPEDLNPKVPTKDPASAAPRKQAVRPTLSVHSLLAKKKTTEEEKFEVATPKRSPSLPTLDRISNGGSDKTVIEILSSVTSPTVSDAEGSKRGSRRYESRSASTSRKLSPTPTSSKASPPKKEWSANVESDILRLYESSSATTSSSLVRSWAIPFSVADAESSEESPADVTKAVERKIEQADHTPSYVQALAKMFKSRMQMRKEREEQMTNDARKIKQVETYQGEDTSDLKVDTPVESDEKPVIADTNTGITSQAHLRYRHIQDENRRLDHQTLTTGGRLQLSQLVRLDPFQHGIGRRRRSDGIQCNQLRFEKLFAASTNDKNANTCVNTRDIFRSREGANIKLANPTDNKGMELDLDVHGEISDSIMNSIATRLDNEARSRADDFPLYKLNVNSEVAKLPRPTPTLFSAANRFQDQKSAQTLARKAKQCLLSNTKAKMGEKNSKLNSARTPLEQESVGVIQRRKDFQARWPASVGSLYLRPPPKLLAKASIQNA